MKYTSKRPWNGFKDADRAVYVVKSMYKKLGTIPTPFSEKYRRTLKSGKPGVVERFYTRLLDECPDALRFFVFEESPKKK